MRTPIMLLAVVAVVTSLPLAQPAAAQGGVLRLDTTTVAALTRLLARIEHTDSLRVRSPAGTSVLYAPQVLPSGLGYASSAGAEPTLDGEAFVLQAMGPSIWKGARIGAVAGGLAGAVAGVVMSGLACIDAERECHPPMVQLGLIVGAFGAATGGVVGGLLGAFIPSWRTFYRYPPPVPWF